MLLANIKTLHLIADRRCLIQIHARFSGLIAASLGCKEKSVDVPDGLTIQQVLEQIGLPVKRHWTVTSVNGVVRPKDTVLRDGDQLFVAPVGGGG